MLVMDHEMKDTVFQSPGASSCNTTVPRPNEDASAVIFVSLFESYKLDTGVVVRAIFVL